MDKITINGKVYKAKDLDFNFLCSLGDEGIDIGDVAKKIFPAIRVYVASCMNVDVETAGEEINKHIINGGNFDQITEVFNAKAEESDFFRALGQENKTNQKKKTSKSEEEA